MSTELRQATNKISLSGVVKEHKLKNGKGENGKYINGSLVIATGNNVEVELKVFTNQMTNPKDGSEPKEKKIYTTLQGFIDEDFPTMASIKEGEDIQPTKVRVYGNGDFQPSFREERYPNQTKTEMITRLSADLGFGNIAIADNLSEEDFSAKFDVEVFITQLEDEVKTVNDEEEETGRLIVKGYVPTYNGGVFPISLVVANDEEDEDLKNFVDDVKDYIEECDTVDFWGDINFARFVEKTSTKGKGIGKAKIEEKITTIHELQVVGLDKVEDEEKQYEEDDVKKAVKQRQIELEEALSKAQEEDDNKGKGVGGNKTRKAPRF